MISNIFNVGAIKSNISLTMVFQNYMHHKHSVNVFAFLTIETSLHFVKFILPGANIYALMKCYVYITGVRSGVNATTQKM
jgi:hypothetical protein